MFNEALTDIYLVAGPLWWKSAEEWAGFGGRWILCPGPSTKTYCLRSRSNSLYTSYCPGPTYDTEKDFCGLGPSFKLQIEGLTMRC